LIVYKLLKRVIHILCDAKLPQTQCLKKTTLLWLSITSTYIKRFW